MSAIARNAPRPKIFLFKRRASKKPMQALFEQHINPEMSGSFAYLGIRSSGMGGAVFLNGKLYPGYRGNAGFFGHTTINLDGETCSCGNKGCLKTYVCEGSLLKHYRAQAAERGLSVPISLDIAEFNALVEAQDPLALDVFIQSLTSLGIGAANIIKSFDIPLLIISGLPPVAQKYFEDIVVNTARKYCMSLMDGDVTLRLGQAASADCVKGCAIMILDMFYTNKIEQR